MSKNQSSRTTSIRPMRALIEQLPRIPLKATGEADLQACTSDLLLDLAENAEITVRGVQRGLGAIGHLLAHSAVPIEDGTIGSDSVESLGFLMAELGDLAAECMVLAARCRRFAAAERASEI